MIKVPKLEEMLILSKSADFSKVPQNWRQNWRNLRILHYSFLQQVQDFQRDLHLLLRCPLEVEVEKVLEHLPHLVAAVSSEAVASSDLQLNFSAVEQVLDCHLNLAWEQLEEVHHPKKSHEKKGFKISKRKLPTKKSADAFIL